MAMQTTSHNVLALDVGEKRLGVAVGNTFSRLPKPLTTLTQSDAIWEQIQDLIDQEEVSVVVVGLPRNLNGEETSQTKLTRLFADTLQKRIKLPIYFQDESLTSVQAEVELNKRKKQYNKEAVDALAAAVILGDFLNSQAMETLHE